jgi:G3E family GTPase
MGIWTTNAGAIATSPAYKRVKGILHLQDEALPVAIHGVHHVFHPPVQLNAWPDDDRRSRIVFITRGLERAEVEETSRSHTPSA